MFEQAKAWVQRNQKEILIAVGIVAIIGGVAILIIKGKRVKLPLSEVGEKLILETPSNLAKNAADVTIEIDGVLKTFPRSEFIRQLHEGWQASAAKMAQAAKMGIDIKPGETIVNACTVTMKAS